MRISQERRDRVVELDRRYRSTWDAHAIAFVVGMSPTTVAKILREVRGPRPKRVERAHTRRTRFMRRDVMWSSDFVRIGWGWLLLKTMDEMSGFVLGWDLVRSEDSLAVLEHAESIIKRMGRAPLVWKFDHGSAFMSELFLGMVLEEHEIVPYPTQRRAPWTNGRVERDHQDILNWLIPLAGRELSREELEREIDEGMLARNYVKPRACLGFRRSAEVYFSEDAALDAVKEARGWLAEGICEAKAELEDPDPEQIYEIRKSGERLHRRAVRTALQRAGHYEEWDTAAPEGPPEAETVNRTEASDVSF
jgi:transposase InsO family protein